MRCCRLLSSLALNDVRLLDPRRRDRRRHRRARPRRARRPARASCRWPTPRSSASAPSPPSTSAGAARLAAGHARRGRGDAACGDDRGLPSLRIRGLQIAITTLAFQVAGRELPVHPPGRHRRRQDLERPAFLASDIRLYLFALACAGGRARRAPAAGGHAGRRARSSRCATSRPGPSASASSPGRPSCSPTRISGCDRRPRRRAARVKEGSISAKDPFVLLESLQLVAIVVVGGAGSARRHHHRRGLSSKGLPQFIEQITIRSTSRSSDHRAACRSLSAALLVGPSSPSPRASAACLRTSAGSIDRRLRPSQGNGPRRARRPPTPVAARPQAAALPRRARGRCRCACRCRRCSRPTTSPCSTAASTRSSASDPRGAAGRDRRPDRRQRRRQVDVLQRGVGPRAGAPGRSATAASSWSGGPPARSAARSASPARSRTWGWCAPRPSPRTCCSRRPGSRATAAAAGILGLGATLPRERELRRRADLALELFGLDHLAGERLGDLPYGTMRIVEIAAAVAAGPDLLLLDEATAGPRTRGVARARRPLPRPARRARPHARGHRAPRAADRPGVRLLLLPRVGRAHRRGHARPT